jgi:hypothetical protein
MTRSGGEQQLLFSSGQAENHLRVADRKPAFAQKFLDRLGQFEQPQRIGHRRAALADLGRDVLLRELELFRELRVAVRLLDGVQIFALQIFDERQLQHRAVVGLAGDDGNFRQIQKLRRAPAAFAGDQFKKTAALAHDERLHDALFADGIGQFAQRLVGKSLRGWSAEGRMRSSGTRWTCSRKSGAVAGIAGWTAGADCVKAGLPPSKAPKPRPKAGFAIKVKCRMKNAVFRNKAKTPRQADDLSMLVTCGV